MKKLIAAALALIIGSSGYVIVDKTIEKRVEDLERSVSSLVEENNSLHHLKEYTTTKGTTVTTATAATTATTKKVTTTTELPITTTPACSYGYVTFTLPNYDIYAEATFERSDNRILIFQTQDYCKLDGSKMRVLVQIPKNTSGIIRLGFIRNGKKFNIAECKLTDEDGNLYVDEIEYFDASELTTTFIPTTTTTTTTTRFTDATTRK